MAGEIELLPQRSLAFHVGHDAAGLVGRAPQVSSTYLGAVASGRLPIGKNAGGDVELASRVQHFARANMLGARFKYVNYYGPGETGPGAAAVLHASVEYPLGTFTPITFDGAGSVTIADGSDTISDPVPVFIPDGALFREWTHIACPGGTLYGASTLKVDLAAVGASVADPTLSGDTTGMSGNSHVYGATAILGMTDKPSVLIIGDSRECGAASYASGGGNDVGPVARPIGGAFGYINIAGASSALWQYHYNATAKLKGLADHCSHIVIGGGINDVNGGDSAASFQGNLKMVIGDYSPRRDKPVFLLTVAPYTTSTDDWATEANQTVWHSGKDAERAAVNAIIRRGVVEGAWGCFDIAARVESQANPGKWLAPGYAVTADGLHGNIAAEIAMAAAVNPAVFGSKAFVAA